MSMNMKLDVLYTLELNVAYFSNVKLDITYSVGTTPNELEYECATVSESNKFSKQKKKEVEKLLECGFEDMIIDKLNAYYKNSNYKFVCQHTGF